MRTTCSYMFDAGLVVVLASVYLPRSTFCVAIVSADEKSDMVLVDVLMPRRGRRAERFSS